MGCVKSKLGNVGSFVEHSVSTESHQGGTVAWRKKETKKAAKEKFYIEGSIPPACSDALLELRVYLDEPELLSKLGKYAMFKKCLDLLLCWADLLEFATTPEANVELQISKALYIYRRYLSNNPGSVVVPYIVLPEGYAESIVLKINAAGSCQLTNFEVDNELLDGEQIPSAVGTDHTAGGGCNSFSVDLPRPSPSGPIPYLLISGSNTPANVASPRSKLSKRLFDTFQHECLHRVNEELFIPFKKTVAYRRAVKELSTYNHVRVDDFKYYGVLGSGTYGFVVRCKKRSTGVVYAMKIQTKLGLLENFFENPERVTLEKDALASCHHPFIISMDYALQTSALAMMVMDIGTAGTLLDALKQCDQFRMPLDRVVFYTAEICLALMHIHRLGMIYRDLKPNNVLLNNDGHIQLVDMGGVVDVGGHISGYHDPSEVMGGLFAQDYESNSKESGGGHGMLSALSRKGVSFFSPSSKNLHSPEKLSPARSMLFSLNSNAVGDLSPVQSGGGIHKLGSFYFGRGGGGGGGNDNSQGQLVSGSPSGKIQLVNSMSGRLKSAPSYKMAGGLAKAKRAQSIMGSAGFMPPEMLILEHQDEAERQGYTHAVDFWSLGVTVHKLLTGTLPFDETFSVAELLSKTAQMGNVAFSELATAGRGNDVTIDTTALPPEYANFVVKMQEARTIPWYAILFVLGMLEPNEDLRLGCSKDGSKAVKFHKFFAGIPWHLLEQKQVTPPYLPEQKNASSKNIVNVVNSSPPVPGSIKEEEGEPYPSFSAMMKDLNLMEFARPATKLIESEQKNFVNWDFISPTVLKLEMGIASQDNRGDSFYETSEFEQASSEARIPNPGRKLSTGVSLSALGLQLSRSQSAQSAKSFDGAVGGSAVDIDAPQVLGLGKSSRLNDSPRAILESSGSFQTTEGLYRGSDAAAPTFRNGVSGKAQYRANSGGKILNLLNRLQQDTIEDAEREEFDNVPEDKFEAACATYNNSNGLTPTSVDYVRTSL